MGNCCSRRDSNSNPSSKTANCKPDLSQILAISSSTESKLSIIEISFENQLYEKQSESILNQTRMSTQTDQEINYFAYYMRKVRENPTYYLHQLKTMLKLGIKVQLQQDDLSDLYSFLCKNEEYVRYLVTKIIRSLLKDHYSEILQQESFNLIEKLCQITPKFKYPVFLVSHLKTLKSILSHQGNSDQQVTKMMIKKNIAYRLNQVQQNIEKYRLDPSWFRCQNDVRNFIAQIRNKISELQSLKEQSQNLHAYSLKDFEQSFTLQDILLLIEDIDNTNIDRRSYNPQFQDPPLIGSIVCIKLVDALSEGFLSEPENYQAIKDSSILKKLKNAIQSKNVELVKNSLVCLSFLIRPEFPEFGEKFMNKKGLKIMKNLIQSRIEQIREVSGNILSGFYYNQPTAIRKVLKYIQLPVVFTNNLLSFTQPEYLYDQLLNIRDSFIGDAGRIDRKIAKMLVQQGVLNGIYGLDFDQLKFHDEFRNYEVPIIELSEMIIEELTQISLDILVQQSNYGQYTERVREFEQIEFYRD